LRRFYPTDVKIRPWVLFTTAMPVLKEKGLLPLTKALEKLPKEIKLLVLGWEPEELPDYARKLGNRLIAKKVSRNEMAKYYSMCSVYCRLSRYDSFPVSVLESMACGTPVVVSPFVARNMKIIKDGVNGYVVDINDSDRLAKRIKDLVFNSRNREKMSESCRKTAKKLSISKNARLLIWAKKRWSNGGSMVDERKIELGNVCNNNCIVCEALGAKATRNKTLEEIKKELREAKEDGAIEIKLCGGEPTIRPDIFDILSYAKGLGFLSIALYTNGRMFYYPDFAKRVAELVDNFEVIVFGHNAEIHERATEAPGSFEQTLRGIKNLIKLKQDVQIELMITKDNYKILPQTAEFFVDLGVAIVRMNYIRGAKEENFTIDRKEAMPYIKKALDLKYEKYDRPGHIFVREVLTKEAKAEEKRKEEIKAALREIKEVKKKFKKRIKELEKSKR
jgi:molybdenum cofactor biosynthesis enzyme MoaA